MLSLVHKVSAAVLLISEHLHIGCLEESELTLGTVPPCDDTVCSCGHSQSTAMCANLSDKPIKKDERAWLKHFVREVGVADEY